MRFSWSRLLLFGGILGIVFSLILLSLGVRLASREKQVLARPTTQLQYSVQVKYEDQFAALAQNLLAILNRQLTSADRVEISSWRQKVESLTVPAEAREFHFALFLKLKQLEDMLAGPMFGQESSLATLQSELKILVTSRL